MTRSEIVTIYTSLIFIMDFDFHSALVFEAGGQRKWSFWETQAENLFNVQT